RIAAEKTGNSEQNSGRAYDEERSLPPPTCGDVAADGVSNRASKRNRDIKVRHHSPADRQWKRIGDDRRRGWSISAFADADQETHRNKNANVVARPDPAVAMLQRITPSPMITQRENRSAIQPKIRELIM